MSTIAVSAGVMPLTASYLEQLEAHRPRSSQLHLFHSAGGMSTPEALGSLPLGLAFSGPAAGVSAASRVGAHAVEVAVDTETGEIKVLKSIGAHDVGQAINPQAVAGQIEGGTAPGQGYALSEEMLYSEGQLVTSSLSEYLIPTAMDTPNIEAIILESRSGLGPFGANGIGEPAMTPVAPAIANAVADAIGIRILELPITPEKVVRALQTQVSPTP